MCFYIFGWARWVHLDEYVYLYVLGVKLIPGVSPGPTLAAVPPFLILDSLLCLSSYHLSGYFFKCEHKMNGI